MLEQIIYFPILGKPLIMWGGITTLLLMLFTVLIAILNKRGIRKIPFSFHPKFAYITIGFALIHGILGLLSYFYQ